MEYLKIAEVFIEVTLGFVLVVFAADMIEHWYRNGR